MRQPALIAGEPQWAIVNISVAHLRAEPSHASEMVSQAILGTPLRLVGNSDGWWQVESPTAIGLHHRQLGVTLDSAGMAQWRQAPRVAVTALREIEAADAHGSRLWEAVNSSVMAGELISLPTACRSLGPTARGICGGLP